MKTRVKNVGKKQAGGKNEGGGGEEERLLLSHLKMQMEVY